jgi:hypothetical protein
MHERLWQIVRRLNTDYEPFGKAEREMATIVDGPRAGGNWCRHQGERRRGGSDSPNVDFLLLACL